MSKLAKKPILIPKGVDLKIEGRKISAKGAKGTQSCEIFSGMQLEKKEDALHLIVDEKADFPKVGLAHALVKNVIAGVHEGFSKQLSLIGVGFRAAVKGKDLDLQLGFSHPVVMAIPEGIEVKVEKNTTIFISGANRQQVGQFAAQVRAKKPPEPYKGKGIRYVDEYVRKKAGKAGKGK